MTKIAFVIYRKWTFEIFLEIQEYLKNNKSCVCPLLIVTPEHEFTLPPETSNFTVKVIDGKDQSAIAEVLSEFSINVVCFFGWSWIVKEPLLADYTCLCLHPSPLPKYRGGSPIQNQLVAGETMSAVSLIKMSKGIDDGDIFGQVPFSLDGDINDILNRITKSGVEITRKFIDDTVSQSVVFNPQVGLDSNPPLKRRTPSDGQIVVETAAHKPYSIIYNLVRGLLSPYPNAYVALDDGIMYLQSVKKVEILPPESQVIQSTTNGRLLDFSRPVVIKVSDGYAQITGSDFKGVQ